MNVRTATISDLGHLGDFKNLAPQRIEAALARDQAECEDFSLNDQGTQHRLSILRELNKTVTSQGVILLQKEGPKKPIATTWLTVPTEYGIEWVMVNCVRPKGSCYQLVSSNSRKQTNHIQSLLPENDDLSIQDILIGVIVSLKEIEGGGSILQSEVRLLGGTLDAETRRMRPVTDELLFRGDIGNGGGSAFPAPAPEGPRPGFRG